jgi:hypothetical protein
VSKKQKLTQWFYTGKKQYPSRPGVYIATVARNKRFYRLWDGERWHAGSYDGPQYALEYSGHYWDERVSPLYWRGLAEQPK